jgi:hypothetical protein
LSKGKIFAVNIFLENTLSAQGTECGIRTFFSFFLFGQGRLFNYYGCVNDSTVGKFTARCNRLGASEAPIHASLRKHILSL